MPALGARATVLARRWSTCTKNSSSKASRARPRSASATLVGRWTSRRASGRPGRSSDRRNSSGRCSSTSGMSASRCCSIRARSWRTVIPSVAGYTARTRPAALPGSSAPRLTHSRGCSWRPWKNRQGPFRSNTSFFWMLRSRKGWPGQAASIMPDSSRTTAWKIRRPFRVGRMPFETTRPMTVTSCPTSTDAIGVMVLASSYRCGTWYSRSPAVWMFNRLSRSARRSPTPLRNCTGISR